MLAITHIKKTFYAFVELSILLITKFKISHFIKHVIFFKITFLFLYSTKFFKHINNCFKLNFSIFLTSVKRMDFLVTKNYWLYIVAKRLINRQVKRFIAAASLLRSVFIKIDFH